MAAQPKPAADRNPAVTALFDAVLFDRDGTLVEDVPYNGDPAMVRPMPGAREALDRLRAAGFHLGVVTNQSGLARGRFTADQLTAVNARIENLLGPFDTWQICPHDDTAGCRCRKPAPGLVVAAAAALGTTPGRCVVVGDIGRDMEAAGAAGATGILVPTPVTRPTEVAAAPAVVTGLNAAAGLVLDRQRLVTPAAGRPRGGAVLVVRSDSLGDVLLTGPAIRAVAAGADRVVLLCGPQGRAAAELLPGVDEIIEQPLPWIDAQPKPVDPAAVRELVEKVRGIDEAVVFTSFHQSALPLALVLRLAGIPRITAISEDYPGSLLDVRHRVPAGVPEPERALSVAAAAGFALPDGDDGRLRITVPGEPTGDYVVVHPGTSAEARGCPPELMRGIVEALAAAGHRVLVTGGPGERYLAASIGPYAGSLSLSEMARLIGGARCLIVGNTGPAHLAAAVGTPVVSLYAPTVPFGQWGPYRVPHVRLGDAAAPCRDTRATRCPIPGHPCLSRIDPGDVVAAVARLTEVA
jgi:histidinol-phosphate phosphatase family protein